MTATLDNLEYLGSGRWKATATSTLGSPTYRWWLDGEVIESDGGSSIEFTVNRSQVPHIEVRDDDEAASQDSQGWWVQLEWYAVPGSSIRRFEIERDTGSGFSLLQRIGNDDRGHWSWRSKVRPSGTSEDYRVKVVDVQGNEATVITKRTVTLYHPPDVPRWNVSRNGDGTVDLTED